MQDAFIKRPFARIALVVTVFAAAAGILISITKWCLRILLGLRDGSTEIVLVYLKDFQVETEEEGAEQGGVLVFDLSQKSLRSRVAGVVRRYGAKVSGHVCLFPRLWCGARSGIQIFEPVS